MPNICFGCLSRIPLPPPPRCSWAAQKPCTSRGRVGADSRDSNPPTCCPHPPPKLTDGMRQNVSKTCDTSYLCWDAGSEKIKLCSNHGVTAKGHQRLLGLETKHVRVLNEPSLLGSTLWHCHATFTRTPGKNSRRVSTAFWHSRLLALGPKACNKVPAPRCAQCPVLEDQAAMRQAGRAHIVTHKAS